MSATHVAIVDDLVVTLEYVLRLEDGEEIGRSRPDEPLQYLHGQGQIIFGLEEALYGMAIGEEKKVVVAPAEGYGEYDADNFIEMPRDAFPSDMELVVGESLFVRDSETDEEHRAFIVEIGPDAVKLDFNHPLAGEILYFDVKVSDLRDATTEELDHGHVHEPGHTH